MSFNSAFVMGKEIPLIQIIVMGSEMLHYPNVSNFISCYIWSWFSLTMAHLILQSNGVSQIKFLSYLFFKQTTAATAMSYYHKHNQVMALKTSHFEISDQIILCSAILFLAGKATERIRRIREVLNVVRYFYGFESNLLDLKEVFA